MFGFVSALSVCQFTGNVRKLIYSLMMSSAEKLFDRLAIIRSWSHGTVLSDHRRTQNYARVKTLEFFISQQKEWLISSETKKWNLRKLENWFIEISEWISYPRFYFHKSEDDNFPKGADGNIILADVDYLDTWKAMEEFVDEGKVRSLGLSNFNIQQIERVLSSSRIKPANLQVKLAKFLCLLLWTSKIF